MSQAAGELIEAVGRRGGSVVALNGRLRISAPEALPGALIEDLRRHKPDLVSYLEGLTGDFACPPGWAEAFAMLVAMPRPHRRTPARWREVIADANRVNERWVGLLSMEGWSPQEVFGVDPSLPLDPHDHMSLVSLIKGQQIVAVTKIAVNLRGRFGATSCIYRRTGVQQTARVPELTVDLGHKEVHELAWDTVTARLIAWFLSTDPPCKPFLLHRGVTIARPDRYWEHLKGDIAAGPNRARGKTGAFQAELRRLYDLLEGETEEKRG